MRQRKTGGGGGGGEVRRLSEPRDVSTLTHSAGAAVVGLVVVWWARAQWAERLGKLEERERKEEVEEKGWKEDLGRLGRLHGK